MGAWGVRLTWLDCNGSLEKNLIVNDEITVSRPTNMPSTGYLKRY